MLDAVTPFPIPLRTPPDTTTYFIVINGVYITRALPINIGLVIPDLATLRCFPPCSSSVRS